MDTQKLTMILLILVIVFSLVTIIMNFSTEPSVVNPQQNIIITDPDDSGSGEVGLTVLPRPEAGDETG